MALRIEHATLLHGLSPCPRGKVGAVIYDLETYAIISDGYNGLLEKAGICAEETSVPVQSKVSDPAPLARLGVITPR